MARSEANRWSKAVGPSSNFWAETYPATVLMGVFVEFMAEGGSYQPRLQVHDEEGDLVGCPVEAAALVTPNSTGLDIMSLERIQFKVPRPGIFNLVLFFDGDEVARRLIWVRPPTLSV